MRLYNAHIGKTWSLALYNNGWGSLRHISNWVKIYSPGNNGSENTISISESGGKYWLYDAGNGYIRARKYTNDSTFNQLSTFWIRRNKWYPGQYALELLSSSGKFISPLGGGSHGFYYLRTLQFQNNPPIKGWASWHFR